MRTTRWKGQCQVLRGTMQGCVAASQHGVCDSDSGSVLLKAAPLLFHQLQSQRVQGTRLANKKNPQCLSKRGSFDTHYVFEIKIVSTDLKFIVPLLDNSTIISRVICHFELNLTH